jgi:hypothetical protein
MSINSFNTCHSTINVNFIQHFCKNQIQTFPIVKLFLLSFSIFIFIFSVSAQNYNPVIDSLINEVKQDSLVSFVRILSGEDSVYINGQKEIIEQRVYNSNDLAADYLVEKMASFGLSPEKQDYAENGTNIITVQEGSEKPDEFYIICAHYDGLTFHAADDNASGSATVLETARILSNMEFPYSIIYALWDEEEIGLIGSKNFAQVASGNELDIRGVINIDMIGYDGDDDGLVEIHAKDVGNTEFITDAMVEVNDDYDLSLDPVIENPGTSASDHSSFWNNGYGAVLLIEGYYSGDFNPYYHSSDDRIDKFNIPYFHSAAQLAFRTITTLANGDLTVGAEEFTAPVNQITMICFPNPSREKTTIKYYLPDDNFVSISVINTLGQRVSLCENKLNLKGEHLFDFHTSRLTKGIYTILLRAGNTQLNKNLVVID